MKLLDNKEPIFFVMITETHSLNLKEIRDSTIESAPSGGFFSNIKLYSKVKSGASIKSRSSSVPANRRQQPTFSVPRPPTGKIIYPKHFVCFTLQIEVKT